MNENELRQALAGHASSVAPVADLARLEAGMVRADRMRTVRAACASAALGAVTIFGVMSLGGDAESTSVDVVDSPVIEPAPDADLPAIGEADADEADGRDAEQTVAADTTTTAPPLSEGTPAYLTASEASTTTTTVVPTTTTAPPPATTAAPTTTTAPAPTTTTTTVAPATIDFTASARYGSCELDPPYDEYSGTAEPGTVITITSPHSAAKQVTADDDGNWFLRVEFAGAPANEFFSVSVTDGTDIHAFDFVYTV